MTFSMMRRFVLSLALATLMSCEHHVENAVDVEEFPSIFPDYIGVTIPSDIAPMDFDLTDTDFDCMDVTVKGERGGEIHSNGTTADFDVDEWHDLLAHNKGGKIVFCVCVERNGKWLRYKEFDMYVSQHDLEEWGLTYRRVAPGYEVYSQMGLYQRDLSSFDEYEILSNERIPGNCVNCHTSNKTDPDNFLFHVRGEQGATVLHKKGNTMLLDTKTSETLGLCVYPYWHKDGRFVAFSTNNTRQAFHVSDPSRVEVFDYDSDLQILDTESNTLLLSPLVMREDYNETYPCFSADGSRLFFCSAKKRDFPTGTRDVRYGLMAMDFDASHASYGSVVDTLIDAERDSISIVFPKPSYDGRYIMFTVADYGTFPIWHHEADLCLLNLSDGSWRKMDEVNSDDTESYHNWSDNSRWFVFSSRREDGLYTRLYLSSIGEDGMATKPFLLPQRNPRHFYERMMYSYNVPDFTKRKVEMEKRKVSNGILSEQRIRLSSRR